MLDSSSDGANLYEVAGYQEFGIADVLEDSIYECQVPEAHLGSCQVGKA